MFKNRGIKPLTAKNFDRGGASITRIKYIGSIYEAR